MDCASLCRLCLKSVGASEPAFQLSNNAVLSETIVTLLGGPGSICKCSESSCNKPQSVCVQCKLDLDFCVEFAGRAKRINQRFGGPKCEKFSPEEIANLQQEMYKNFSSLYNDELTPENRLMKSIKPKGDSCQLNEILTREGKVAIPPVVRPKTIVDREEPKPPVILSCSVDGCLRKFSDLITLQNHLKRHNSPVSSTRKDSKPFVCNWPGCSKVYKVKSYLIEHERVHAGHKPFWCETCGKTFYRILDLKKHKLLNACKIKKR